MDRQSKDADDGVGRGHDRIAEHDRVHRIARLAEHRADQDLPGGRHALQQRRIEAALHRRVWRPGPGHRPAFGIGHQRVVQERILAGHKRQQHFGGGRRIERQHAGMPRRGVRHRVGGLEVPVHVHDDRRRHRAGLGGKLPDVLVISQARAISDGDVDQDRQDDDEEKDLASERLGQGGRRLPANRISDAAELAGRLHQLLQSPRRGAGNCHSGRTGRHRAAGHSSCGSGRNRGRATTQA
jgi:hypothetical protein